MEMLDIQWSTGFRHAEAQGDCRMLQAFFMQRALSLVCSLLGGFGVFCVLYSFSTPHIAAQALILLASALAINYFIPEG
jgi:multisubunit Na+/H+ antiporter MnhB subunit